MGSTEPFLSWFDMEIYRANAPRNSIQSLGNASTSDDQLLYSQFLVDDDESDPGELLSNPTPNHHVPAIGSSLSYQSIPPSNPQTFTNFAPAGSLEYSPPPSSSKVPQTTLPSYQGEHTPPASKISAYGTIHSITEDWTQPETSTNEHQTIDQIDWEGDLFLANYVHEFPPYPGLQEDQSIAMPDIPALGLFESTLSSLHCQDYRDIPLDRVTSDDSREEPSSTTLSIGPLVPSTTKISPQPPISPRGPQNDERFIIQNEYF